ncbi:MAG: alkaline phosphatase [Scytonematopsis contorta HA4267-MV1]|jgi:alkaline phosphatase|nr:alkaline phosphatase [Scytonematopsis contorta HA4267-MV1]
MFGLLKNCKRFVALVLSTLFFSLGILPGWQLPAYAGNGVNVILMIGDGMGWEMARAAAVANGAPMYTSGKGSGLAMQTLTGYGLVTTYGTTVKGATTFSTGNSALDDSNSATGASPIRSGFTFNPAFNPGTTPSGGATSGGNLVGYDPTQGGLNPWTPITPAAAGSYNKEYIKYSYPDSANTATTLYTGVKSYNNAMGVDIYEQPVTSILQKAALDGKATGLVTSVPITHATPGAAVSFVNRRNKYDSNLPITDSILQQALGIFKPNVLLGGGHPLDQSNTTAVSGTANYTYIQNSTYTELKNNPTGNRYGYRFLERGPNATSTLLSTAATLDPQKGDRLLGLYGARGQDGNLPVRTANGDYGDATSGTGLAQFSLATTANPTTGIPTPDIVRPVTSGETTTQFIARERNENPTLGDLTQAALNVLGKDPDGFWLMVEGGDVDWAAHDDNMDNLIGNMLAFDEAVQRTITWIGNNGGWSKNMLIITADHDHYLTLNSNFPTLLAATGAQDLTYNKHTPATAGYFHGSDPTVKYGWTNHSNRPVPVYFQGPANFMATLNGYVGQPHIYTDKRPGGPVTNYSIPGIADMVDQSQIYLTMLKATTDPATGPATGRRTR